ETTSRRHVPETNGAVPTAAGQDGCCRTKGKGRDRRGAAIQGDTHLTGLCISQLDCLVGTTGGKGFAIGAEHNTERMNRIAVPAFTVLPGRDIPTVDSPIPTVGHGKAPIRAEGH